MTFLITVPYKYSYSLTEQFLVDNIYGSSINNTYKLNFLLEGAECYKDTHMTAQLVQVTKISNKVMYFISVRYTVTFHFSDRPKFCNVVSYATATLAARLVAHQL